MEIRGTESYVQKLGARSSAGADGVAVGMRKYACENLPGSLRRLAPVASRKGVWHRRFDSDS